MGIIKPYAVADSLLSITAEYLQSQGIQALMVDVDNTVFASCDNPQALISRAYYEHLHDLQSQGIRIVLVSNNTKRRVQVIAAQFDLPFVSFAIKPSPLGFMRAKQLLGVPRRQIMHIGDQYLTDVIGGKLFGLKVILVDPLVKKDNLFAKPSRFIERRVKIREQGGIQKR